MQAVTTKFDDLQRVVRCDAMQFRATIKCRIGPAIPCATSFILEPCKLSPDRSILVMVLCSLRLLNRQIRSGSLCHTRLGEVLLIETSWLPLFFCG